MGVHDAIDIRARHVSAAVDIEAGHVEMLLVADDVAVEVHLDQARSGNLVEQVAVTIDEEGIFFPGNARRQVRINEIGHPQVIQDVVKRRQITALLPFCFTDFGLVR